jgi:UDP-N-acetylglucosamine acyltransferase
MSRVIHPSAVVEEGTRLGAGVRIGPFCYVGRGVELGNGCELVAHATVLGPTRLGAQNTVYPYATLGTAPQDRSYGGEPTSLWIGDGNVFREGVTVHRGTVKGAGRTCIGSRSWIMAGAHVAHDCALSDRVVVTTGTVLGGHVTVGTGATLGGKVAVAPFVRIGRLSFAAGGARVEQDVPPFLTVAGDRARVRTVNRVGLERAGIPGESVRALKKAFWWLYRRGEALGAALHSLPEGLQEDGLVAELVGFLREGRH